MLLLVATSLLGPYVMAQFTQFAYNVRYTAGAVPAYLLLLGIGALWALRHRPWGWGLLAAFAVLTGFSLASYYGNPYYFRDDNRGAARFIAAKMRPGEPVIVGAEDRAFAHYFRGPLIPWTRWRVAPAGSAPADGTHTVEGRIWVAANRTWEEPPFQELLGAMQECLALETEAEFPGYRVYAFRAGGEEMERCSVTYRPSGRRAGVEPAPAAAQP
jgi:hypothetical protein